MVYVGEYHEYCGGVQYHGSTKIDILLHNKDKTVINR